MAIQLDASKCTGCASCEDICPVQSITVNKIAHIDEETCIDCGSCVLECPEGALSLEVMEPSLSSVQQPEVSFQSDIPFTFDNNNSISGRRAGSPDRSAASRILDGIAGFFSPNSEKGRNKKRGGQGNCRVGNRGRGGGR